MSTDGRLIETRSLFFEATGVPQVIKLTGKEEKEVRFTLRASNGGTVTKIYRFRNGAYDFDVEVVFDGLQDVIANYKYELAWDSGLRYSERNSVDESNFTSAHIYTAGEHMQLDASHFDEPVKMDHQGKIDWVAQSTKYFLLAIIPQPGAATAAYLEGNRSHAPNNGVVEHYSLTLEIPYKGGAHEQERFRVFLGPADYHLLTKYDIGLENVIYLGWTWIVRPISVYIMLPVFTLLHTVIPNWGIVLIIFAIIIKIALHPLTKTSMKSMKKMQTLQPMMEEIRAKYKDDPQKMNAQIMNLYKEYGVNPAGSCLPTLLQFPILIALYNVFRSAIELRQANFFWWISDLSIPDKIVTLPFTIPVFGVQEVSGLALLMGITTFIQQKMSVKDPRQKTMVWMMPVMMTLLFNSFPSGLNLYYFMFNLLSIGQQMYINKQHDNEPLRKIDQKKSKRGGFFGKLGDIPRINKKS
jgi:YidC/Oxa1 family membrane protein insertase